MPAGVAKLSIAALKRTISRAGLSTDGLIERRELEEAATRALQILEERWRESSDDEESPPKSKPKTKISTKTKSQKRRLQPRAGRGAAALVRSGQLGGAVRGARGVM